MPQQSPALAERPLLWLTRLVLRFPGLTLVLGGALALGALALSHSRLGFRTSRLDVLNPASEFNRVWTEYLKEFGDQEDAIIVIEGPTRDEVLAVRDELGAALMRQKRLFHSILSRVDTSKLRRKGLYYLSPEALAALEDLLDQVEPIVKQDWSLLNVARMMREAFAEWGRSAAQGQAVAPEAQAQLGRFFDSLLAALAGQYRSPWPTIPLGPAGLDQSDASQLLARDGRMGFILLRLAKESNEEDFVRGRKPIQALRRLIAQTQAAHPQTRIGLTGIPVIEHDEMVSSQSSMARASLVSLVAVSLLFVAGFGGWRHPLLAMVSLTIGTAWAMGYITLAIGHLNILSSAFAVILIGQGIDFSMYYVAQYLQLRSSIRSTAEALERTVATVGPGVATGAVTTAVAFFMAGLTEFTGVAELGIIAGGGILLCWIAGLTILPAMIHLTDSKWPHRHMPLPVDVRGWLEPLLARPRVLLAATSTIAVVLALGLGRLRYDHNLLHLQAQGLESVELEQKLLSQTEQSASYALSLAETRQEALARKAQFERLPAVHRVEEIASQLPGAIGQKRPLVEAIHRRLAELPDRAPTIPASDPAELAAMLAQAEAMTARGPQPAELHRQIQQLVAILDELSPAECQARLSAFQQRVASELLGMLHALRGAADPDPPDLSDLPEGLVCRFVGRSGRYLLKVYARGDIWDMPAMSEFARQVRTVDPRITGSLVLAYEGSLQMQRSYKEAALYALVIIVPVVFLDFRSVRHSLMALLPLGLGMVLLFGLLGWLDIPLNPANMIVLPLILGIGIDAGVHVVHDYCAQRGGYRISASTASAVVINSVTNMAGFGALMVASHRGLQSLGRVLTLGLSCCLFTSLVMLPAFLVLMSRASRRPGAAQQRHPPGDSRAEMPQASEEPEAESAIVPGPIRRGSRGRSGRAATRRSKARRPEDPDQPALERAA